MPTDSTNRLPESTGIDLGSAAQRYDAYIQNLDVSGTVTLAGNVTTTGDITADQFTSTVATGSAPLSVSSTTKCTNLNADLLDGADWATPGAIGSTTPAAGSFTTLTTTGNETLAGNLSFTSAANRNINFSASSASSISLSVSGCASTAAAGGGVDINGGPSSSAGSAGGAVSLNGGTGSGSGAGGQSLLAGGTAGSTGTGGQAWVSGGAGGSSSGAGGAALITPGSATAGNGNGGDLDLRTGVPNGSGNFGRALLTLASSMQGDMGAIYSANTTPVTVNTNTTSDQNLMSYTLPAKGGNRAGRLLRVHGYGVYTTQSAQTPTVTISVKLGSVTLASWVSSATTASQSNKPWNFNVELVTVSTGATGTIEGHGNLVIQVGSGASGADAEVHADTNTGVSSSIDLTASNTLQITVAFSTNAATANTCTQRLLTVEAF